MPGLERPVIRRIPVAAGYVRDDAKAERDRLVEMARVLGSVEEVAKEAGVKPSVLRQRLGRWPDFKAEFYEALRECNEKELVQALKVVNQRIKDELKRKPDKGNYRMSDQILLETLRAVAPHLYKTAKDMSDTQGNVMTALDNLPDDK